MGLNSLRIHIKIGDPRYYIAADRVGLLIWTEMPNWQLLTDGDKRATRNVYWHGTSAIGTGRASSSAASSTKPGASRCTTRTTGSG